MIKAKTIEDLQAYQTLMTLISEKRDLREEGYREVKSWYMKEDEDGEHTFVARLDDDSVCSRFGYKPACNEEPTWVKPNKKDPT